MLKHFRRKIQLNIRSGFYEFEQTFNAVSMGKILFHVKRVFIINIKVVNQSLQCGRCLSDYWSFRLFFFFSRNTISALFEFHLTCCVFSSMKVLKRIKTKNPSSDIIVSTTERSFQTKEAASLYIAIECYDLTKLKHFS